MRFGYHVKFSGTPETAIENGAKAGCETIQFFPGNPRQWGTPEVTTAQAERFLEAKKASRIEPVIFHSIYLVNLAAPSGPIYSRSVSSLASALSKAEKLDVAAVVTHIGNHKGRGERFGLERIGRGVNLAIDSSPGRSMLLLETTAGAGTSLGGGFEQFGKVFDEAGRPERLGFCLDTCHVFAAGYDISTQGGIESMLEEIDENIGLDRLELLHLNDSKGECGSHLDRHADIGEGRIGLDSFRTIVNHPDLRDLPAIVELPYDRPGAKDNLSLLRSLID